MNPPTLFLLITLLLFLLTGENIDVLEAHQLMLTVADNQPLNNLTESKTGLAASVEPLPRPAYSEPCGEQPVMIKLERGAENFQTLGPMGSDDGPGAPRQSQPWKCEIEKSGDAADQNVFVLLPEVRYPISPAAVAGNEQQGFTAPINGLPFSEHKNSEQMDGDAYSVLGMRSTSSSMSVGPELRDQHTKQEVAVNDFAAVSDGTHKGNVFEFNLSDPGQLQDNTGEEVNGHNCFICSSCGQSFDSFTFFQRHQCTNVTELPYGCHVCGKMFSQMSALKLHLKLHVE